MNRAATIAWVSLGVLAVIFAAITIPIRLSRSPDRPAGKALFQFSPEAITGFAVTNGDEAFEVKQQDAIWSILPRTGEATGDRASVPAIQILMDTALTSLVLDRVSASEISNRDKLAEYGLRTSRLRLDFKGDKDLTLLFGKESADGTRIYVRFEDALDVYLIDKKLGRLVVSSVDDFRDRSLFSLRPNQVDRILLRRPAGEMELHEMPMGWALTRPLAARADDAAVATFLNRLFRLRIAAFENSSSHDLGALGLSEPNAEVELYGAGDTEPQTLRLGTLALDGLVAAQLMPRNIIVRLPKDSLDYLSADLATFRDRSVARLNLDFVDLIRVVTPAGSFALSRAGSAWIVRDVSGDQAASGKVLERLATTLAETKAVRYEAATPPSLGANGFDTSQLHLSFFSVVSENTPEAPAGEQKILELSLGHTTSDGLVPVYEDGSPEIAFVLPALLEAIPSNAAQWNDKD